MEQEHIYRVLLELKESTGKTIAGIDDIKRAIVDQSINHDKLREDHETLRDSHNSIKGKVLWISGLIGIFFGIIGTWIKTRFLS